MVKPRELAIPSSDGHSRLHVVLWEPKEPAWAVVQLVHGMVEHILRYDSFACYLAEHGIAVVGHDHLGHGKTAEKGAYGHFGDRDGRIFLVKDVRRVYASMRNLGYGDHPYYMLGHSMGSFVARRFMALYGGELSGAIIMGTGDPPLLGLVAGRLLAAALKGVKGATYPSPWLHHLALGRFSRAFAPARTDHDWLTRQEAEVDRYRDDPLCNFRFTAASYQELFHLIMDLKLGRQGRQLLLGLPTLILSGQDDPVGDFGKGVKRVFRRYQKIGMLDVQMHLYPGDRHELLNEMDKEQVYAHILEWITQKTKGALI